MQADGLFTGSRARSLLMQPEFSILHLSRLSLEFAPDSETLLFLKHELSQYCSHTMSMRKFPAHQLDTHICPDVLTSLNETAEPPKPSYC